MNFIVTEAKIFAFLFLFFANFSMLTAQDDSIYRLPAGTKIRLSMDSEISSEVAAVNDTFTTTVAEPVTIRKSIVLPSGAIIEGRVLKVSSSGIGSKKGKMQLIFETIRFPDDQKRSINGVLVDELKVESSGMANAISILGGAAVGAIVGIVSSVDNGAIIGAGIGAGAGTGVAVLRKGKDVRIRTDEKFVIELKNEVTLPVRDY